jgi:hypothetical protein
MAYEIPGFSFTLPAGADLSALLFRGITTNSSGKVVSPAAGAGIIGALNNKPKSDEAATVVNSGIAQMEAGATIVLASGLTPLKVDNVGRVVPQAGSGVVVGYALEAAAASGIIIAVLLTGSIPVNATEVTGDQANVPVITTPDATDDATVWALANANKAKINALIATLVAAGVIAAP